MRYLKNPAPEEYLTLLDRFPHILKWTVAPELDGALEMGQILRERGIIASIGHSNATEKEVEKAIHSGYTMVTHLYNGMSRLTRKNAVMHLGVAESALIYDELTAEIIAGRLPSSPIAAAAHLSVQRAPAHLPGDGFHAGSGNGVHRSLLGGLKTARKWRSPTASPTCPAGPASAAASPRRTVWSAPCTARPEFPWNTPWK